MAKIVDVCVYLLEHALDEPFQSAFSQFDVRGACLVEVKSDDGLSGWGECLGPHRINGAVVAAMKPRVVGKDPSRIDAIWLDLYNQFRDQGQRGVTLTALSGLDIALWDLAGKRLGAPVHELMGGAFRNRVRAYATGGFRRLSGDRPAYIAEETRRYVEQGFHAVKIKIGYDVDEDLQTIAAVREAIGPGTALMIDANHGYDRIEAIHLAKAAVDYGVDWFEEPVVPEDLEGYREVRAGQPLPVAGGETWHARWAFREALERGCLDIAQPDVCGVGGLSEARRVADLATAFHVRVVPHVWGTGVALAAALQYLAILPPTPQRHESRDPILEFDRTHNPYRQAVLAEPIEHEGGVVAVPTGPGLGIEINRDALETWKA